MRYYATASGPLVRQAMTDGLLGCILTPRNSQHPTAPLIADNGCFGKTYVGDDAWFEWLSATAERDAHRIAFATAPDVVANAAATWERSEPWLPRIRALGVPAAYVAQDGVTSASMPWGSFDVLFVGGSTGWKLGEEAAGVMAGAVQRGIPVHMGRVNTLKRLRYAYFAGCTSVDGTYLAFGPDVNLPRLLSFIREATYPTIEGTAPCRA